MARLATTAHRQAREVGPQVHLLYLRHVSPQVVSLSTRALITCLRIEGASFETRDPAELNDLHAKLNLTLRNIADERLALWSHVVRRRVRTRPAPGFRSDFARSRRGLPRAPVGRGSLSQRADAHPRLASRSRRDRARECAARTAAPG